MRVRVLIVMIFLSGYIQAQHLNKFGHFSFDNIDKTWKNPESNLDKKILEKLTSGESSVIEVKDGFITLTTDCDNAPTTIRLFNKNGKEIFTKTYSHTINFSLSSDKSYCAFNDLTHIVSINLLKREERFNNSSNTFAIDNNGDVAYFDNEKLSMNFKSLSSPLSEMVYKICFYKGQPLFITKKSILIFNAGKISTVYNTNDGRIFDVCENNNDLYISTKTELPGQFVFKLYSSSDLKNFNYKEEINFPLSKIEIKSNNKKVNQLLTTPVGEPIRDPLYYFNDTVYQPIGNSYGEIQDYSNTPSDAYLHPGVDLLGNLLQDVRSVKKGYVKAILTTSGDFHWRIAISNENTSNQSLGYLYAHIDSSTFAYAVGDSVNEGDVIGQLVDFPVPGFIHCHFARITDSGTVWFGAWWTLQNPLCYMTNFFDTIPPTFETTFMGDEFAFRQANGNYIFGDSLYGPVKIISKVHDVINSSWNVDVNNLRYNLSPLAFPQTILLDSFAYEFNFYTDVYVNSLYTTDVLNTIYSRDSVLFTDGDYQIRDFYHIVTNSDGNDTIEPMDSTYFFNTTNFEDGVYILRVIATDPSGNTSVDSMIIGIYNGLTGTNYVGKENNILISPNPSTDGRFNVGFVENQNPVKYEVYNSDGQIILSNQTSIGVSKFNFDIPAKGVYLLRIINGNKNYFRKLIRL